MLSLAYFTEGIVRAASDPMPSKLLAIVETGLATALFVSLIYLAREIGRQQQ